MQIDIMFMYVQIVALAGHCIQGMRRTDLSMQI